MVLNRDQRLRSAVGECIKIKHENMDDKLNKKLQRDTELCAEVDDLNQRFDATLDNDFIISIQQAQQSNFYSVSLGFPVH